jgi:cysteine synthase A
MQVTSNILDLIGKTPLLQLSKIDGRFKNIYAKAEFLNPGGSIKDRIAINMIEQAEKDGLLKKGMTIVEPTSGNTGIGVALVGIQKGYDVMIIMPENMSEERKKLIKALGAKLILTPKDENIEGTVHKVEELKRELGDKVFSPQQFINPANPDAHYKNTAQEIYAQMDGKVDIFVSGLGSGGTLAGIGKFLKEKDHNIKVVAVEPKNVSALLGHEPGFHKIQGIGDGFIPDVLDPKLIDDVIEVTDDDAVNTARQLAKVEGALCGTSSGANVWASIQLAQRYGDDKNIVTILADRAERYFSTALI